MSIVQYGNEKFETKKVYFTGTSTLREGYALCYDADRGTAADPDPLRAFNVEQPATGNFANFAGFVSAKSDGVVGPKTVEILVPVARGQKANVWSGASNTIDVTELRLKTASFEVDTDGTGPIVARAMQTVDRSTASGVVQALILGSGGVEPQGAIVTLVDALDGAALTGDTLTTSATPTVDELEACVGSLGGKINAILAALRAAGVLTP